MRGKKPASPSTKYLPEDAVAATAALTFREKEVLEWARFRALVKQINASANYNQAIGEALGIEGAQQTGPDLSAIQPDLDATVSGSQVQVGWGWGGQSAFLDLCEIEVDRGAGAGFTLLTYDSTPNYTDTSPFPATATKWIYRAIYRVGDHRVGLWSKPVSATVGG